MGSPERATRRAWPGRALAWLRSGSWYPAAFAVAFVLSNHLATHTNPAASFRPLVFGVAAILGLQAVITLAVRDRHAGALLTSLAVLAFINWPAIRKALPLPGEQLLGLLVLGWAAVAIVLDVLDRRATRGLLRGLRPPALSRAVGTFAVILVFVVAAPGVTGGVFRQDLADLWPARAPGSSGATGSTDPSRALPDIYLIVLDSHARQDTLQRLFSYDDSSFLQALEKRGFMVSPRSRTNYPASEWVFPSMLTMQFIADIPELQPVINRQSGPDPAVRDVLNNNPVYDTLRQHGYQVIASAQRYEQLTPRSADRYLDDGYVNEFELQLLRTTGAWDLLGGVAPDFLSDQQRGWINADFGHIAQVAAEASTQPRFLFVYVPAPHMPAVFGPDGEPMEAPDITYFYDDTEAGRGLTPQQYTPLYTGQLQYIDTRVIEAVDEIRAHALRPPVIIVMSDHGSRSQTVWTDFSKSDTDEVFSILFAAYTPGHPGLFPSNVTPVNIFPLLFNAYLGTSFPTLPNRTFAPMSYWQLEQIPNPDGP